MRKCQHFSHVVRIARLQIFFNRRQNGRNEKAGKTDEMLDQRGARIDGVGPGGVK